MTYETIRLETDGGVARLTLDRPAVLNAINRAMIREIHAALDRVEADEGVRVPVVQGAGRAFSAGFDLKESAVEPIRGVAAWREVLKRDLDMVRNLLDHAAGRLEEDRQPHSPWMPFSAPLVSASGARAWFRSPTRSVSMAASRRGSPSWPSTIARNSGTSGRSCHSVS